MNNINSIKQEIDSMSYEHMLKMWRFENLGSIYFVGEIGEYFATNMYQKRAKLSIKEIVEISKRIGWDG